MKTTRHTKIVATVGPASSSPEMLRRLVDHGVNTFRLNFSHGTHADHQRSFNAIGAIAAETGRALGILQDLQGPKIRIGVVPGGPRRLTPADRITFSLAPSDDCIPLPHPEIFAAIAAGQDLLIDDGRIRLRVVRNEDGRLETQVVAGGVLSDRKGVNLPGTRLAISPLTDKDRADLAFGLSLGVDWVALSFVQSVADVVEAKTLIGTAAKLIAKIEKPQALEVIADIIAAADGIMVARGDLGVEIPPEDVPGWQKDIITMCRRAGRPVIVATQMLESMIQAPVPTRAETSDVATAVSDGADAVMLSAETAAGQFPCECVMMMDRILRRAEAHHRVGGSNAFAPLQDLLDPSQSVAAASVVLARMAGAAAIIGFSESGVTMARLARERSETPVFVLTPHAAVRRQSSIFWGLDCRQSQAPASYDDMVDLATRLMRDLGYGEHGKTAVLVAGTPVGQTGSTNTLRLIDVG